MEEMVKVAAVAVTAALCAMVLQRQVQELALVLSLAAGAIILVCSMDALRGLRAMADTLAGTAGISAAILSPVVKTVGISVITRTTAELCRDAKESGIASFVETAGAALALFVALPLLEAVLQTVIGLL